MWLFVLPLYPVVMTVSVLSAASVWFRFAGKQADARWEHGGGAVNNPVEQQLDVVRVGITMKHSEQHFTVCDS
jgi:hypothetical protein